MKTLACETVGQDLVAYLDGQLDPAARQAVDSHLGSCAACRAELEALGGALNLLDRIPATQPGQDFSRRFWARFESERGRGWAAWFGRLARPRWAVLVGSSLAAGLLIGFLVLRPSGPAADADELAIARDLELYADYEAIVQLELLEDLDAIEALGEG